MTGAEWQAKTKASAWWRPEYGEPDERVGDALLELDKYHGGDFSGAVWEAIIAARGTGCAVQCEGCAKLINPPVCLKARYDAMLDAINKGRD